MVVLKTRNYGAAQRFIKTNVKKRADSDHIMLYNPSDDIFELFGYNQTDKSYQHIGYGQRSFISTIVMCDKPKSQEIISLYNDIKLELKIPHDNVIIGIREERNKYNYIGGNYGISKGMEISSKESRQTNL